MKETIEEVKEYLDEDYWERGQTVGKSGYEKFFVDFGFNRPLVECLRQAYDFNGKTVLDVGCAMGGVVACLVELGIDAYGMDLSPYAIKKGQDTCDLVKGRIFEASAHDLSIFGDETFDFIYSNQVFEHVPDELVPAMMAELYRVMKPGAVAWVGLVLGDGRGQDDPDETHITIKPREWWHERIVGANLEADYSVDERFRPTRTSTGYSFFEQYGWHAIGFRKAG